MAKSRGEVPYSDELAKFLKMYVPQICLEKMIIPPEFIKNYPNIPTTVTLVGSNGDSWQVDVNRINENHYFQKGWPKFVQENSLEYRDFMEFYYDGKSTFYVEVLGPNGFPKSDLIENGVQEDILSKPESSNRNQIAPRKSKPRMCSMETKSPVFASNGCAKSVVTEKDIQEDEAYKPENPNHRQTSQTNLRPKMSSMARKSPCRYPCFKVVMTESYVRRWDLHIPRSFSNLYLGKSQSSARTVTLRIKHKSWLVNMVACSTKVVFTAGWSKFMKDNCLENGSECTFKLIDENELVFEIDIRRYDFMAMKNY